MLKSLLSWKTPSTSGSTVAVEDVLKMVKGELVGDKNIASSPIISDPHFQKALDFSVRQIFEQSSSVDLRNKAIHMLTTRVRDNIQRAGTQPNIEQIVRSVRSAGSIFTGMKGVEVRIQAAA